MCYISKETNFKETEHSAFIKKNEIIWGWRESKNISGCAESFYSFPVKCYFKKYSKFSAVAFFKKTCRLHSLFS